MVAAALRARLEREAPEIVLWQDRVRLEGGVGWWRQIAEALDVVEFLVLVMTSAALASPVARKEWQYARQRGVCVYPVKGDPDGEIDYSALPKWMAKAHFFDPAREWDTFVNYLKSPCHARRVPFMAPDLSETYVERPAPMEQLLGQLLDPHREDPVAITTALRGAGGLGKTTLAAALCHHDDVVSAFDDGILWVTLGQSPNLVQALLKLYAALTGERPGFVDIEDAAFHLAEQLEDRNCLIVIDDVWQLDHLKPFLRGGAGCARLITTRNFEIAAEATRVEVDEMTPAEAVRVLSSRIAVETDDQTALRELAHRLGEWPLLLAMANAALRQRVERRDSVAGALRFVTQKLEQQGVTAFDQHDPNARSHALRSTIELSLSQLDADARARYELLAIFPEDTHIPIAQAARLWSCASFAAEELVQRFDDLSLLTLNLKTARFELHDVLRSFALGQLQDAAAAHRRLAESWVDPYRLPDDYAWRWLAYHLVGGAKRDRLRELLLDFGWLTKKLDATDASALLADLQYAGADSDLQTVHAAVRLAAHVLAKDVQQLAAQLLGRLPVDGSPALQALRDQAARWRGGPWLQPLEPTLAAPGGPLLFTLSGHAGPVRAVAVAPDGQRAVSASNDATVRVWDLERGIEERSLSGHADWVRAVAISRDGRLAASTGDDQTIRVWDLDSGTAVTKIDVPGDWLRTLAFAANGSEIIAAGDGRSIVVFDVETARAVRFMRGHTGTVNGLAVTRDGRRVASAADDRTIRLWDLADGRELRAWRGHKAKIIALALAGDDRFVISASRDDTLCRWELAPEPVAEGRVIAKPVYWARALALTPDAGCAIVGGDDALLSLWDVQGGTMLRQLEGHAAWINAVAVTPDGSRLVSASDDGTLKVWDLRSSDQKRPWKGHRERVRALVTSSDGRIAVSTGDDGLMRVWDIGRRAETRTLPAQGHWPVALSSDGSRIVKAAGDATVSVIETASGSVERVLSGHQDRVRAIAVTPDGSLAITAADDRTIHVWSLHDGARLRVIATGRHWVRALAASPDGQLVLSASEDRTLKAWNLKTGAEVRTFYRHAARVNAVAVTREGLVVSASDDGTLRAWRLDDGSLVREFLGHAAKVNGLALLPDQQEFVSVSDDFTVRLWRIDEPHAVCAYSGENPMLACAFCCDGTIIAGDQAGRVHFLQTRLQPD